MTNLRRFNWLYLFFALASLVFFSQAAHAAGPSPTQIIAGNSGQCLQPQNASTVAGAPIVQNPCTSDPSTSWSVVQVGSAYQIVSQSSGMCLNIAGNSTQPGAQLIQWPCQGVNGANNDKWQLNPTGSGQSSYFQLVSLSSGYCANVNNASTTPGATLVQWQCQDPTNSNDQFYLSPSSIPNLAAATTTTGSSILAAGSGQCLQPAGDSTASNTGIVQTVCAGAPSQAWSLAAVGSYYHVISQSSGLCLNVSQNSMQAGAALIQWPCQSNGATNDQWTVAPVQSASGNYFHLVSRSSGMCANINNASLDVGAAVVQWPCQSASVLNDQFAVDAATPSTGSLPSAWTAAIPLPVNAVAVANLPNGNLLLWSAYEQFSYEGDIGNNSGQTYWSTFNPTTQVSSEVMINSAGADLFCPGIAVLPNGNVLVNGGSSSPKTTLYNLSTGQWQTDSNMIVPRGYEADTLLSNGSVLTFGGSWSGGNPTTKNGEVWTSGQGWTYLNNAPDTGAIGPDPQGDYRGDNHMWLFAQSNGMVFQAGPSAQMNWIGTSGTGSITSAGNRGTDPYSINGNAVLYDIGKILKVGGAQAYQQNGNTTTYATNSAYTLDITGGPRATVKVKQVSPMLYARSFSNAVVLPTGDVVVVGGQSIPNPFTDTGAVLTPEIWNHSTQTFTALNPMQTPRTYHSTALLLADGRIFVGGGGQCGAGCADNHLSAEILTPSYLLNADGSAATRPAIVSAPTQAALGSKITVTTSGSVSSFALMRLSATTHTVNNDQRRIPLTATPKAGQTGTYTLAIPSDPGVALPGYYMLFALNAQGVPSMAATVQVH